MGAQYEGYEAPSQDAGPGSVFVFKRRNGQWTQQAMLRATRPQDSASFGRSVEISAGGGVIAVGAPYEAVDAAGQFLGDVQLSVTSGGQSLITVRCGGPWLLLRIPPGSYRISGLFEGRMAETTANVPMSGQGRAVLRFPNPN